MRKQFIVYSYLINFQSFRPSVNKETIIFIKHFVAPFLIF